MSTEIRERDEAMRFARDEVRGGRVGARSIAVFDRQSGERIGSAPKASIDAETCSLPRN
jgi:hypothetical protein